jgi:hypothetical protein
MNLRAKSNEDGCHPHRKCGQAAAAKSRSAPLRDAVVDHSSQQAAHKHCQKRQHGIEGAAQKQSRWQRLRSQRVPHYLGDVVSAVPELPMKVCDLKQTPCTFSTVFNPAPPAANVTCKRLLLVLRLSHIPSCF